MPRLRPSNSSAYTPSPAPTTPNAAATPANAQSSNIDFQYESPSHELTQSARDRISMLLSQYPSQNLNMHLKAASDSLTSHVDEINTLSYESKDIFQRQQGKRARESETGEDESAELDRLQKKVTGMTNRMEASVRKCIDSQARVDAVNRALKEIQTNAQRSGNTQGTQATAAVTQDGQENEDEPSQRPEALRTTFDESLSKHSDAYLGKSAKLRYKEHDWFKNFKNAAYYAANGEDAKRINPDTWFQEDGEPQPGETGAANTDEDLEEMGERISTKCPLTLQEFKEPVTSKKCPHSFEKAAITDLLKGIRPPTRGHHANWTPEIECPVPGCDSRLGKNDLEEDMRLKIIIKRRQRQRELARQQAEEEDEERHEQERSGRRVEEIESGSEDDIDNVEGNNDATSTAKSIKRERARRATQDAIDDLDD
ncbi:MAG: hypothetical protein Q9162_007402 [Coniocarpon cinnabarinum]